MKVIVNSIPCVTRWGEYTNGRIALQLITDHGEPWCTASVNMPDSPCPARECYIKNYSENEGVTTSLIEAGVIMVEVRGMVSSGFVHIARYALTDRAWAEYERAMK